GRSKPCGSGIRGPQGFNMNKTNYICHVKSNKECPEVAFSNIIFASGSPFRDVDLGHRGSDGLHGYVPSLDHVVADVELDKLRKRFELIEAENVYLNKSIERMDKELHEAKDTSFHLSHQIENSENLVKKKEVELLAMEKRLKASETLNIGFYRAIKKLKMEQEESRMIKEDMDRKV
ncbi:hypothetical protein S83_007492, partial [Arachis hypogaea]